MDKNYDSFENGITCVVKGILLNGDRKRVYKDGVLDPNPSNTKPFIEIGYKHPRTKKFAVLNVGLSERDFAIILSSLGAQVVLDCNPYVTNDKASNAVVYYTLNDGGYAVLSEPNPALASMLSGNDDTAFGGSSASKSTAQEVSDIDKALEALVEDESYI
jgi:hypothetical protein